jgi:ADP-heptose:LPS heptosyltransferase
MKKLLLSYHGLGDHIVLTPVLRAYKKQHPNDFVGLTYLRRLPIPDLMKKCKYVNEWVAISDAWNDYENFEIGYRTILEEAKVHATANGYDEVIPVTMSPNLGITHKIHRASHELGIEIEDFQTEIFPRITKKVREQADQFLEKVQEPYVFVHLKTGNSPKDVSKEVAMQFLGGTSPFQVIEYGSNELPSIHLPLGNIPLEMEILSRCSQVVCADSFIMHAACALGIPTKAIYISTPPEWVIPLHSCPLEVYVKI